MRKAITPIISIILLLLIMLAFTGSTWMFLSGYMGGKMISMEAPPGTAFCKGSKADILLVNSGTDEINISTGDMMLGQFQDHANVVGAWGFDEDDGNVSVDGSGNGNDGSIYGDTLLLMRFDETPDSFKDSTNYFNDGNVVNGIAMGYTFGNLVFIPNQWGGAANGGEFDIECPGGDANCEFTDRNGRKTGLVIENGVACNDVELGGGYIMYSEQNVHVRFAANPPTEVFNADNFICVRYNSGWEYDTNTAWFGFTPVASDTLVAAVDFTADTVSALNISPSVRTGGCQSGSCLDFDGLNDYVDFGDVDMLEFDWPFTASAWVKVGDLTAGEGHSIVGKGGGWPNGWILMISGGERPIFQSNSITASGSALSQNEWHHIVGTYDGADLVIYVDGVEDARTPIAALSQNTGGIAFVGALHKNDHFFNGSIDEVAIFNRSLTPEEIQAQYNYGKAKFVERVPSRFGYAMGFDGLDDYVNVSGTPALNSDLSVAFWVAPASTTSDKYILDFSGRNEFASIVGYQDGFYNIYGSPYPTGTAADSQIPMTGAGVYDHVVWSKSGNTIKGYVNGVEETSVTISVGDFSPSVGMQFGRPYDISINSFSGRLDEVVILDAALTPAEVAAQMTPACTCVKKTCVCGDVTIVKSKGEGDFFPYMSSDTIPARGSVMMTDYSCLSDSCAYWIATPAMSFDAVVNCR